MMPYRPGFNPELVPHPTRPKPNPVPRPTVSRPSVSRSASSGYSNPDLVSHRGTPAQVRQPYSYRPQVAPSPPPYHYNAPSRNQRVNPNGGSIYNNPIGREVLNLIQNGGSDYEVSLALDAAISHRYNFIVNNQQHQANQATHDLIKQFNQAQDEMYNPPDLALQARRRAHDRDPITLAPNLKHEFKHNDAFDAVLPGTKGTLRQFNKMIDGLSDKQTSYMGSTLSNMLYASKQEHGTLNFDKERLKQVRSNYRLSKQKNAAFDRGMQEKGYIQDANGEFIKPSESHDDNIYGDQVKSKDDNGGFFSGIGKVAGAVGNAIGDASGATVHAAGDVLGKIPGPPGGADNAGEFGDIWNNDLVKSTRHILSEDGGAALSWTLDKLSRPEYAVAGMWDKIGALTEGEHAPDSLMGKIVDNVLGATSGPLGSLTFNLTGISPTAAGKGAVRHPSRLLDIPTEAGKQFVNGGVGNADNPTTFGKVISHQAERDKSNNIYDNESYQIIAGLLGDVANDPLNFIGVGAAKVPVTIVKDLGGASKTAKLSKNISDVLKDSDVKDLTPEHIQKLITGGSKHLPRSVPERVQHVERMLEGSTYLSRKLDQARRAGADTNKLDDITEQLFKAQARHQQLVKDFGLETTVNSARNKMAELVKKGDLPESKLAEFDDVISTTAIQKHLGEMISRRTKFANASKAGTEIRQNLGLSEGSGWDEVLGEIASNPAYKGRLREFEGHAAAHETGRAFDLLPESIKQSGLFTEQEFDDLLGNAYRILTNEKSGGRAGEVYRKLRTNYAHTKKNMGSTTDDYELEGYKTALRHNYGKQMRVQAAVVLQMIKDAARRKAGEEVFQNPERVSNLRKVIDEVDSRLADAKGQGATTDLKPEFASKFDRDEFTAAEGPKSRNFTDIMRHINDDGTYDPELFEGAGGFYSGEQQLDRIRQFAERGIERERTQATSGYVKGFGPLDESQLTLKLPEHLSDPEVVKHYIDIDNKGNVTLKDVSDLTQEDQTLFNHLRDSVLAERENLFSGKQASLRALRSDELTRRAEKAAEGSRKEYDSRVLKGIEDRIVRNADGYAPYVEHNGSKIIQGSNETAKLVTKKDHNVADKMKTILNAARYPGSARELDDKDMANLRWLFKQNGVPVPENLKTADDWHKFFKGNRRFFDNQSQHQSDEFRAYNETVFRSIGKKATDPNYQLAKLWVEPGHIAFNREFKAVHQELPYQADSRVHARVHDIGKFDTKASIKGHRETLDKEPPIANTKGYDARREEASQEALKVVTNKAIHGNLKTDDFSVNMRRSELPDYASMRDALETKHASERKAVKLNADDLADPRIRRNANARRRRLESKMAKLKNQQALEIKALEEANSQGKIAAETYQKQLLTENALQVIQSQTAKRFGIQIRFMGGDSSFIPAPAVLMRGADRLGGIPLVRKTRESYAKAFGAPTKGMDRDLVYARAKRTSQTPKIIEAHVKHINSVFKDMPLDVRRRAFKEWMNSGPQASSEAQIIQDELAKILPYYQRQKMVKDAPLSIADINRFLPEEFRVNARTTDIETTRDLFGSLRGNDVKKLEKFKGITGKQRENMLKKLDSQMKDPYHLLWSLHIGIANAEGNAAMRYVINDSFGIKRAYKLRDGMPVLKKDGKPVVERSDMSDAIERLGNQDIGWKTIPQLGDTHYFPGEIAGDIGRLLDSFEPHNIDRLSELFDSATRSWKAAATIYNPGYYTRNGIGEIMATWIAGHQNPKDYVRAAKLIRYGNRDGKELESISKSFPLDEPLVGEASIKGSTKAFQMRSGEDVSYEKLWLALNDQGISPGFFNTEVHNLGNMAADRMSQTPGLKQIVGTHRKLRDAGEDYETYLRSAHFIAAIRKSKKPFEDAIKDAAMEVRKYHFDYTDFSDFEKMVMLRAFPFYKWTRRAIPLFFGQMFLKPGKMMAYPKAMNAASNLLTSQDIAEDPNGFLPNYHGIVPTWMQDMMAYQISGDTDSGLGDYLNIQTPQISSLQSGAAPLSTGYSMFNPLIKVPAEMGAGHTFGDQFGQYRTELQPGNGVDSDKVTTNRINELLGTFPAGKFASRGTVPGNSLDKAQIRNFLTGMGDYENTPARQYGELMDRQKRNDR